MALGMTGPGGLRPSGSVGLTPAQGPAQAGLTPAQSLAVDSAQLPVNWLTNDMQSPTIDWGQFAALPTIDYATVLNKTYKQPQKPALSSGFGNFNGVWAPKEVYDKYSGTMVSQRPTGTILDFVHRNKKPALPTAQSGFRIDPNALNFKDSSIDAAIDKLNQSVYGARSRTDDGYYRRLAGQSNGMADIALNWQERNLDKAFDNNFETSMSAWSKSPIEMIKNQAMRDKMYADAAAGAGISVDDLKKHYGTYAKAYNSLADPVGANWQDLKKTGNTYSNDLLPGIRKYSGFGDDYFKNLESMADPSYRNSAKYLSPEYFALHTTSKNNQYGSDRGMIGNTAPGKNWKEGFGTSNPYALEDWTDYLKNGKTSITATPAERAIAEQAMAAQQSLLNKPVAEGGQFNLWKETGVDPYQRIKAKGGKWKPINSAYTNKLNVAQNFLGPATRGEKNFKDAGYDETEAYRSGFRFDKDKKKGFGKVLSGALGLASFIPGPIGVAARIGSALNAAVNKDYLGAVLGGLGAMGVNPLGGITSKLSAATGFSPSIANALVQGGVGGLSALQNKGDFLKGALGSGLGTYTTGALGQLLDSQGLSPQLAGAVSGGTGSAISNVIQGGRGSPVLVNAAMGAASGYNRGSNIAARRNRQRVVRK
jgi:hypothetical protein